MPLPQLTCCINYFHRGDSKHRLRYVNSSHSPDDAVLKIWLLCYHKCATDGFGDCRYLVALYDGCKSWIRACKVVQQGVQRGGCHTVHSALPCLHKKTPTPVSFSLRNALLSPSPCKSRPTSYKISQGIGVPESEALEWCCTSGAGLDEPYGQNFVAL